MLRDPMATLARSLLPSGLACLSAASLFGFWAASLWSCAASERRSRPLVVVSVPPQAWLVRQLAGDLVDLEVLIPPGANPVS